MKLTGKDHVDIVLDTKPEVVLVLLRESGQIDVRVGQVDALAGRDEPVVPRLDLDGLLVHNLDHVERQHTVIHVDDAPWLDHLGDVLVVDKPYMDQLEASQRRHEDSHVLGIGGRRILLVGRDVQDGASRDGQISIVLGVTSPDLGSLGVQSDGNLAALLGPLSLTGILDDGLYKMNMSAIQSFECQEEPTRLGRAVLVESRTVERIPSIHQHGHP